MAPVSAKKRRDFDPEKFLATIGQGRNVVAFSKKQTIFTQGNGADAVFYIQEGKVRLTVVSEAGKEMSNQAPAGSNPESGVIFVATITLNRVALLRTLPEMVMRASETRG